MRHVRLPPTIDRAEVPGVVARCLEEAAGGGPLSADCRDLVDARLPAVDVIARVALALRRDARSLRLEHASPELLELLRLCGLDAAVGDEAVP